jgi:tetratricopeptide (TPR) repeat protein
VFDKNLQERTPKMTSQTKSFISVHILRITTKTSIVALLLTVVAIISLSGCARRYNAVELYNRGFSEYVSGNCTGAIGLYKWSLKINEEYPDPMIGLAHCYMDSACDNLNNGYPGEAMHDLEEALYWSNLAVNADPGNPIVTQTRMRVLDMRGETEQAIQAGQWGTNVQGDTAQSFLLMARAYIKNGAFDEAELAIKQALAVEPNSVQTHIEAGRFYELVNKPDIALFHYEEVYKLDSTNTDAQLKIAELTNSN